MKVKYIILTFIILLLCGCTNIKDQTPEDITASFSHPIKKINIYRTGYNYYLPTGIEVESYQPYSEVLNDGNNLYYLYVDLISYYNKKQSPFTPSFDAEYSYNIEYGDKSGYLEVNLVENNQYLIEIMFNYAKIEVMVDEESLNFALSYSVAILRSISYNDDIIKNLVDSNVLSYTEEEFNIFHTKSSDSNYLKRLEEDEYVDNNNVTIKDKDMLN